MSLSFWIRDYVFIPLATRHRAVTWHYFVTLLAMTLFGLWHGATAGFVIWGVYQGVLLVLHRLIQQGLRRSHRLLPEGLVSGLGWALTFGGVSLGWLLFRARDVRQAVAMQGAALSLAGLGRHVLPMNLLALVALMVGGYFLACGADAWLKRHPLAPSGRRLASLTAPLYYAGLVLAIIVWSKEKSVFVYFQF